MADAMRALRRLRDGETRAAGSSQVDSLDGADGDNSGGGGKGDGGGGKGVGDGSGDALLSAEDLEAYSAPLKREHGSMLCMLVDTGQIEFAHGSMLRQRACAAAPAFVPSAPAPASSTASEQSGARAAGAGVDDAPSPATVGPFSSAQPPLVPQPLALLRGADQPAVLPAHLSHESNGWDGSDGGNDFGDSNSSRGDGCRTGDAPRNSASRGASRAPSESASVPPTEASFGSGEAHGDLSSAMPTASLVRKLSKRILRATLEPLAESDGRGGKVLGGDWAAQLAQLETRVHARIERLPNSALVDGAPTSAAVGRAVRAELLEVLRGGLRPASRASRQPPQGLEQAPASKAARHA